MITSVSARSSSLPTTSNGCPLEIAYNLIITAGKGTLSIGKKTIKILSNKFIIIPSGIIALSLVVYICLKKIINFYREKKQLADREKRQRERVRKKEECKQAFNNPKLTRAKKREEQISALIKQLSTIFYSHSSLKNINFVPFRKYLNAQSTDTIDRIKAKKRELIHEYNTLETNIKNIGLQIRISESTIYNRRNTKIGMQGDAKKPPQPVKGSRKTEDNKITLEKIEQALDDMIIQTIKLNTEVLEVLAALKADHAEVLRLISDNVRNDLVLRLSCLSSAWQQSFPYLERLLYKK